MRANLVGALTYSDPKSSATAQYFNTSAFSTAGLTCGSAGVPAGAGTYGTTPRNFLRGPGFFGTNLALQKSTPLYGERLQLTLRAEMFNAFNNVEFSDPNTNIASSNFGRISSTADPRIVQFAVRLKF